jgi:hypothetical protein
LCVLATLIWLYIQWRGGARELQSDICLFEFERRVDCSAIGKSRTS